MDDDDTQNNLVAAGAVYMALTMAKTNMTVDVEIEDGHATNRLIVSFDFMKSPYRLTVERVPDPDESLGP